MKHCELAGFWLLNLEPKHMLEVKNLTRKDPFDKLILCQAIVEDMIFMTHDARIAEYISPVVYKI